MICRVCSGRLIIYGLSSFEFMTQYSYKHCARDKDERRQYLPKRILVRSTSLIPFPASIYGADSDRQANLQLRLMTMSLEDGVIDRAIADASLLLPVPTSFTSFFHYSASIFNFLLPLRSSSPSAKGQVRTSLSTHFQPTKLLAGGM